MAVGAKHPGQQALGVADVGQGVLVFDGADDVEGGVEEAAGGFDAGGAEGGDVGVAGGVVQGVEGGADVVVGVEGAVVEEGFGEPGRDDVLEVGADVGGVADDGGDAGGGFGVEGWCWERRCGAYSTCCDGCWFGWW